MPEGSFCKKRVRCRILISIRIGATQISSQPGSEVAVRSNWQEQGQTAAEQTLARRGGSRSPTANNLFAQCVVKLVLASQLGRMSCR